MTLGGILIMCFSVGFVSLLLGTCLYKVFTVPNETEHMHGFEIKTPDEED